MILRSIFISGLATLLSVSLSNGQSVKIGKVDNDGNCIMTINSDQGRELVSRFAENEGMTDITFNDVLISTMPLGQFCLTGYQKDPDGKVIKGFRIECYQDDENNLILRRGNKTQTTTGKDF